MIDEESFNSLVEDIKQNGLHDPLVRHDGKLLDGRTRLLACYICDQEIRVVDESPDADPWAVVNSTNIQRRQLTVGQKAVFGLRWVEHEKADAKKRQVRKPADSVVDMCPQQNGKTRDAVGKRVGVSGRSIDRANMVSEYAAEMMDEVANGDKTLQQAVKVAAARKKQAQANAAESPVPTVADTTTVVTAKGAESQIQKPKKVVFNRTNDSVDWASWTWNPVTGCEHGCKFCYAREIANSQRMAPFYPNKFEPTFHEYRLDAPVNTKKPDSDDNRDGRVFVCSMADLFGRWVPKKWIQSVFDACQSAPQWEYLFLTKWPAKYAQLPLLDLAWYGASVIQQADVKRVESAMQKFEAPESIKWISLEPMLEPIVFNNLSWCDLVVIGSQTSTNQPDGHVPAFAPKFDWVVDVVNQCRDANVPYYLKANLGKNDPGMTLPNMSPREANS
jgi:protein gp37/ParB-like chromosome segregation protein Spo0J